MIAVLVAVLCGAIAALSIWRLPALHPAQLWSLPWAAATTLYAVNALPYHDMSADTAAIILGAVLAFAAAAWQAGKIPASTSPRYRGVATESYMQHRFVALLLASVTAVWLGAFLLQLSHRFGLRAAFVSSPDVRRAVAAGELAFTIKFVYAALAAVVACVLAAATVPSSVTRRRWLAAAVGACGATYFSTGRSNVMSAVLIAALCYAAARPLVPTDVKFCLPPG